MYPEKLLKSIEFEPSIFPLFPSHSPDPCAKVMSSATGTRVCLSTPENCSL